ncbi:MAG: pyridoxamine 5'-phosphate oxidase [Pseudomonadales bacterium]|nr:pyridoxamine 5'-phosphate oxidase [Pseudomonadales bacterium]
MDISQLRREYVSSGLRRSDLDENPFLQFERWFKEAIDANLQDPNAMCLATADKRGRVSQRIVLLKNLDQFGFIFYTNTESRKAQDIASNPQVSLHFAWLAFNRQVKIQGKAQKIPSRETLKYFLSRPRDSQIAAWCSSQSSTIDSRQILESKFFEMKQKFANGDIPLPSFWSGYKVIPETIEFWQGRENRLHDRFMYRRTGNDNWEIQRLAP